MSLILVPIPGGCSGEGESEAIVDPLGPFRDILGSITRQGGGQSEMSGWVIALVDRDSLIARVAVVDGSGSFTFPHVFTNLTYTMILVSPAYVVQSMFVYPAEKSGVFHQYFKIVDKRLPRLIHQGSTVTFQQTDGVLISSDLTPDIDGDGIPDGHGDSEFGLVGEKFSLAVDTDGDGRANEIDPDIEGDGIINIVDPDDDGDGLLDPFDPDSDGDNVLDSIQTQNDLYFPRGIKWVTARYELASRADGTIQRTLLFACELHKVHDVLPIGVKLRGALTLLDGSVVESRDEFGETVLSEWDNILLDDGLNFDSAKRDLLFGRRVILGSTKSPDRNQVVFFQLVYADGWTREYAYTFPPVVPAAITSTYDSSTRVATLTGNPYGTFQEFNWFVTVFEIMASSAVSVFSSTPTKGTTRTLTIPANTFEEGKTYKFKTTAQLASRIPGFPPYSVESTLNDIK